MAASLPREGFIAGLGKQLMQQVLGRELEACRHLPIRRCSMLHTGRDRALGSARGQAELGMSQLGMETPPCMAPRAGFPRRHSREGPILHQLGLGSLQRPEAGLYQSLIGVREAGDRWKAAGEGSCLPLLHAPSMSCSPRPGRSFQYR